ncbi:citrulline utilization hydrolase CtlX [Riemerella columbipharyngis]|uniref:Amidinotransferase n=1 Tax=Riemerella columbipharyngis TaxID=1071918 RepID=A0A1G7E545_9FLAO|nr:arginine deiminase-related protein [Riemerella columbipharyngis]SDE58630.1 hypothetical protein SAMN05421544_11418 [Riemerella columbipharyngis]
MQTADTVLMIEPVAFEFNTQTAENNYFQIHEELGNTQEKALAEFNRFVEKLRQHGITVITVKDTPNPHTPDSIFPNNWISFSQEGNVYLYPMFAPNRRDERRPEIIEAVKNQGYTVKEIFDFSPSEKSGKYLEGTGSMIFDHDNKLAYGSVSIRLDETLFREFCEHIGYTPVVFHSFQNAGEERLPIYHTNVMMCVAEDFVIICLSAIDNEEERKMVINTIKGTNKEIFEISEEQMEHFAGNMLQLRNDKGERFLVMSQSAYNTLSPLQIQKIEKYCSIISADLHTIETNGGGSARCMLAEVFLPKA